MVVNVSLDNHLDGIPFALSTQRLWNECTYESNQLEQQSLLIFDCSSHSDLKDKSYNKPYPPPNTLSLSLNIKSCCCSFFLRANCDETIMRTSSSSRLSRNVRNGFLYYCFHFDWCFSRPKILEFLFDVSHNSGQDETQWIRPWCSWLAVRQRLEGSARNLVKDLVAPDSIRLSVSLIEKLRSLGLNVKFKSVWSKKSESIAFKEVPEILLRIWCSVN